MSNTQLAEPIPTKSNNSPNTTQLFKLHFERGLSYREIEKMTGLDHVTVCERLQRFTKYFADPDQVKAYHDHKSSLLTATEQVLLENLANPEKIKSASLNNVAYAYQQIFNANRLEKGQSTENIALSATMRTDMDEINKLDQELIDLGINTVDTDQVVDVEPASDNPQTDTSS